MNLVVLAKTIATVAHEDQVDKNGAPYILHPEAVASFVETDDEKATAWLHDVLEDTPMTAEHLLELGFPRRIVDAVVLLTRTDDVPNEDYYAGIKKNPLAREVKRADIKHNTLPERLEKLPRETQKRLERKYKKASRALGY